MRRCPYCAGIMRMQYKPGTVVRTDRFECTLCGFKEQ